MPVDIDALEEWTVGDRMLHGMELDQAREAEWRRGTLPPGRLGWRKATEIRIKRRFWRRPLGPTGKEFPTPSTSTSTSADGG